RHSRCEAAHYWDLFQVQSRTVPVPCRIAGPSDTAFRGHTTTRNQAAETQSSGVSPQRGLALSDRYADLARDCLEAEHMKSPRGAPPGASGTRMLWQAQPVPYRSHFDEGASRMPARVREEECRRRPSRRGTQRPAYAEETDAA